MDFVQILCYKFCYIFLKLKYNFRFVVNKNAILWWCHPLRQNQLQQVLLPQWPYVLLHFHQIMHTIITQCTTLRNKEWECYRQKSPLNQLWYLLQQQRTPYQRHNLCCHIVVYRSKLRPLHHKHKKCPYELLWWWKKNDGKRWTVRALSEGLRWTANTLCQDVYIFHISFQLIWSTFTTKNIRGMSMFSVIKCAFWTVTWAMEENFVLYPWACFVKAKWIFL